MCHLGTSSRRLSHSKTFFTAALEMVVLQLTDPFGTIEGKVSAQKASAERKTCTIQLTKLPFGRLKGALLKLDKESGKC